MEKGSENRGGGGEKLEGKKVGEENDEDERRGEVIGVCLCIYICCCSFSPLSNTVAVGSD